MQMRRKQEFSSKSLNAYEPEGSTPALLFPDSKFIFLKFGGSQTEKPQGAALLASLRLATGQRPEVTERISAGLLPTFRCKEKKADHSALRGFRE